MTYIYNTYIILLYTYKEKVEGRGEEEGREREISMILLPPQIFIFVNAFQAKCISNHDFCQEQTKM